MEVLNLLESEFSHLNFYEDDDNTYLATHKGMTIQVVEYRKRLKINYFDESTFQTIKCSDLFSLKTKLKNLLGEDK
jgi:hypothetical protein